MKEYNRITEWTEEEHRTHFDLTNRRAMSLVLPLFTGFLLGLAFWGYIA